MKAHKVPATYYASWKIPGTKHSFYVFYKDKLYSEGQSKSYKDVDKITQEHSFFMEENFYYLDIENMPRKIMDISLVEENKSDYTFFKID